MAKKSSETERKKQRPPKAARPKSSAGDSDINLLNNLRLLHVRMITAQANLSIKDGKTPGKAQIQSAAMLGISLDRKNIHVNATLDVLGRPDLEKMDGSILNIHLEYQVVFQVLNDIEPEKYIEESNPLVNAGMMIVWPNFRETVMSITAKMSIPPLILPMFIAGAAGVTIGGTNISFTPIEGPPAPIADKVAEPKPSKKRIQGYH